MDNQKNEHIQLTRNQKLVLTSSSLGFGLENMDVLFLSFTMSSVIASLHISAGAAGLIGTITNWGMLLGGVLFGMLGDRFGRVKTFTYTIFVFALATALMSIANNITSIYIFRFIAGIGAGGEYGLGITLIAEAFPKKELGRMSSIASIPTDSRINPSVIPIFCRTSGGMDAWVIDAGWHTRLSTPPRLSASATNCREAKKCGYRNLPSVQRTTLLHRFSPASG